MIIELKQGDQRKTRDVTRVCDECGKQERTKAFTIERGRKSRGTDWDLCLSCSHTRKYRQQFVGDKHWNWAGGVSTTGYFRTTTRAGRREYKHVLVMEEKLGRELKHGEVVHHIDLNKLNNAPDNLWLFQSRSEHLICHHSLEKCGYALLGQRIWFDWQRKVYSLSSCLTLSREMTQSMLELVEPRFQFDRKADDYRFRQRVGVKGKLHVLLTEMEIGRKINRNECVHHVDGSKGNNDINNLCLMSLSDHKKAHYSLQQCAIGLHPCIVFFDKGTYRITNYAPNPS